MGSGDGCTWGTVGGCTIIRCCQAHFILLQDSVKTEGDRVRALWPRTTRHLNQKRKGTGSPQAFQTAASRPARWQTHCVVSTGVSELNSLGHREQQQGGRCLNAPLWLHGTSLDAHLGGLWPSGNTQEALGGCGGHWAGLSWVPSSSGTTRCCVLPISNHRRVRARAGSNACVLGGSRGQAASTGVRAWARHLRYCLEQVPLSTAPWGSVKIMRAKQ